jgi:hypothetical protein
MTLDMVQIIEDEPVHAASDRTAYDGRLSR